MQTLVKKRYIDSKSIKKKIAIAVSLWLFNICLSQSAIDTNYSPLAKSVYLSPYGAELQPPIVRMAAFGESQQQLMLRFDMLGDETRNLRWRIEHCDAQWQPDGLPEGEFINGAADGPITGLQFSFTTRTDYVNYYQPLPDPYASFTASGNYLLTIYNSDDGDSPLFSRRFCVVEDLTDVEVYTSKPSGAFGDFNHDQQIDVGVSPKSNSFLATQASYYKVVVQQNRRTDLMRTLPFQGYSQGSMLFQWAMENIFPGGNHFRYFDISNLWAAMYHVQRIDQLGNDIFAFLQPDEDRSRKPYTQYNSLNGGMKTNIRDRENPDIEADYVWVNFSLPMERPYMDGSVHIVGDLTNWSLGDESRMTWNAQYKTYIKRLQLKQGYYSYQLLFLPIGSQEAMTAVLEGDHTVMPNSYTVYVYYISPGSRFDRLVGLRSINFAL